MSVVAQKTEKLQKILAESGLGSRREMERLIEAGRVTVNGQVAPIGTRVGPADVVRVDRRVVTRRAAVKTRVILYHKPEGEIVSRDDPDGRPHVFENLPMIRGGRWIAVGRLDYNTEGLLIFTNSGELANHLAHPRFEVEREYAVRIVGVLTPQQADQLREGILLEDGPAAAAELQDCGGEGTNHWYRVVVTEGRQREVRRMFEAMGFMVSRLIRTRFGQLTMPRRLAKGRWHELEPVEVDKILRWAGLKGAQHAVAHKPAVPRPRIDAPRQRLRVEAKSIETKRRKK